jgi:hypothetical protein
LFDCGRQSYLKQSAILPPVAEFARRLFTFQTASLSFLHLQPIFSDGRIHFIENRVLWDINKALPFGFGA